MKIKTLLLLLMVVSVFFTKNVQSGERGQPSVVKRFSIEVKGQLFKEVLGELERKSGYLVTLDEELGRAKITGNFSNVTLEEFLHRALKEKNIVLEFGENGNVVNVQSFKMASTLGNKAAIDGIGDKNKQSVEKESMGELKTRQLAAFAERKANPDAIDPMTGIPQGTLVKTQEKQLADFTERKNDPESKDPLTGVRRGDLQVKQELQAKSFAEGQKNPDMVDPMSGLRRGDLKELQAKQLAAFMERNKK